GERDPGNPGLWFSGFKPIFTGYFDAAGIAADRIAAGIAADTTRNAPFEKYGAGKVHADNGQSAPTKVTA
ncbi:MAG: hypothetical protein ABJP82_12280, partial [Hyphomicrobiales bacterium]